MLFAICLPNKSVRQHRPLHALLFDGVIRASVLLSSSLTITEESTLMLHLISLSVLILLSLATTVIRVPFSLMCLSHINPLTEAAPASGLAALPQSF